ncbi:Tof1p NDAI_0F04240 [Naumovozyma dairenensis CBS 421]|uniref:Topoisomerase 1-associated factor 1 n=1 Tax=Naumovozyma dairenensis (strain ATCC 10597 / BCRC 20456 / CBS 421 / NBRC 0211 / NRRL Y-12639) TaxID=1071378 RepID=G0WD81_NAUDC|nr:hypothetical protein NDAI_0F04240 [Naumovozyma dairenensis CBS 421]CCD25742.1 hypothetical protein NDAI_0F04240 [Naumovozyma dairenensis CBS 421]
METNASTVLKARIALLATAIGGPDYASNIEPPPYKLGDDCLACLRDLKRWFKLVDDEQNRWDVAMAAAEYRILTDDLIPILIDWENKSSALTKLQNKNNDQTVMENIETTLGFRNKVYYDKVALSSLQLLVLMTWPLVLTDQSTSSQIAVYSELKKHQLIYKKEILTVDNGKVLKAAIRLALNVFKIDRLSRTPRDNMIIKLVLNFFRNVASIEPGNLTITVGRSLPRGINSIDTLPPNVTMDDISLNAVLNCFHRNKVYGLLLTLSSSLTTEFDQDFINIPLLEIMFFLTKDVPQQALFPVPSPKTRSTTKNKDRQENVTIPSHSSYTGFQLSDLLKKENEMKKNVIRNTSTRHSNFGALLSVQTPNGRISVSGTQGLLDDAKALDKIDRRKKWNKRRVTKYENNPGQGLPNSLLNSQGTSFYFQESTLKYFKKFINNFIGSAFNTLLHSITNYYTTEQDRVVTLEKVEYLLFFGWFLKYQVLRCKYDPTADITMVSGALRETSFILVLSFLRTAYEMKHFIVVHAGMIAFNELLVLVQNCKAKENDEDIEFIISKLFSNERIQLLSNLPKTAFKHTHQYMKSCVDITHTVLKTLEQYTSEDKALIIEGKSRRRRNISVTKEQIEQLIKEEGVDRDEAIDMLTPHFVEVEVNFERVQRSYINEQTIDTYMNFLQRYDELEPEYIKKVITFFHRVFIQAKEETMLFRLDLIVLFRDMLAPDGIDRTSRVRKHVQDFVDYYLNRLNKKLKSSPTWFIDILFPSIHDSEIGYFQRYGERKAKANASLFGVPPSVFKNIEDEHMLPPAVLKDMKYGILVSSLIDDDKTELLEKLIEHIKRAIDIFSSWLTVNINNGNETANPPNETFKLQEVSARNPLLSDKDFRALLQLIGYQIPMNHLEQCILPGTVEITALKESLELVKKYMNSPFETPNGLPSSSYLLRPRSKFHGDDAGESDGWVGNEEYDYNDRSIINDDEVIPDDNDYFKDLGNAENSIERSNHKGIAKSKRKPKSTARNTKKPIRRRGNRLPDHDIDDEDDEGTTHYKRSHQAISSKEYISDSDDDEDELMNPIFFENEMYLRWLLDKHNGQIPPEKNIRFAQFAAERMANNGETTSNFIELFDGPIPNLDALKSSEDGTATKQPDNTLKDLSAHVAFSLVENKSTCDTSSSTDDDAQTSTATSLQQNRASDDDEEEQEGENGDATGSDRVEHGGQITTTRLRKHHLDSDDGENEEDGENGGDTAGISSKHDDDTVKEREEEENNEEEGEMASSDSEVTPRKKRKQIFKLRPEQDPSEPDHPLVWPY